MAVADIEAIVGGYHGDAFRVLGPHIVQKRDAQPCWEVRTFLPQADSAEVVIGETVRPMIKRHKDGLFVAQLDGEQQTYRIRARLPDGRSVEHDDPYRFPPLLSSFQLHLHAEGTNYESYTMLGAHLMEVDGVHGTRFAVWAPNAEAVTLVGDFNDWDTRRHPMRLRDGGIWEFFLPGAGEGCAYKYNVRSRVRAYRQLKADPYAFYCEKPLTYREMAETLVGYARRMGYTHLQFLPIMEHPFSGSWGYQLIGYFAPTSRFGPPEDFMYLVDRCHQEGIAVIVDWVPAHFPKDAHGLVYFDGTALYEHADPRKGEHRDWGTLIFNYGRNEVREFLISNALFWLKQYHIDGLRDDAVASMLYLDYSREPGEWIPNQYGGNENLEAIDFIRRFNELAHQVPGAVTIAEESTAFSGVSRPVYLNGLGFTMKWNMGWMHDMLEYFSKEPVHRKHHHHSITFSMLYAFTENFVLPISHDEVVHGKRSLLSKMPGDEWQRFANARSFLAYMYAHPGKKLLFMGSEIGQYEEWNHAAGIPWELIQFDYHRKLQVFVSELNRFYVENRALYEVDFHYSGFEWVDFRDVEHSVIAFLRKAADPNDFVLFCCNFTPVVRAGYEFGVPAPGVYDEVFNTDAECFGGGNVRNGVGIQSRAVERH